MNKVAGKDQVIKLEDIIISIKRRWKVIIGVTVTFAIITAIFNFFIIKPEYKTEAQIFVGKEISQKGMGNNYNSSDVLMYQNLMKTYSQLMQTKNLVVSALDSVNEPVTNTNVVRVMKGLSVTSTTDSQILDVTYETKNKEEAVPVMNAIVSKFKTQSKKLIPNVNIELIENPQVPTAPVSPNKAINIIVGAIVGLLLSVLGVFIMELFDKTVKNTDELEELFKIPVIGSIPYKENI